MTNCIFSIGAQVPDNQRSNSDRTRLKHSVKNKKYSNILELNTCLVVRHAEYLIRNVNERCGMVFVVIWNASR